MARPADEAIPPGEAAEIDMYNVGSVPVGSIL